MINVGIIGFGFMGRMHTRCWRERSDSRVVAVCDTNSGAVQGSGQKLGNIAGAEGEVDLSGIAVYSDPAEMLACGKLDAVSITVPTYLHAKWSVRALEAGVHVLCEKPMALTRDEGRSMIEAAGRNNKVLQIGHCIRFWPEYAKAKELVDSGAYGRVIAATFRRLSATARSKQGSWFSNEEQSGGMVFDLHIHDTDFVQHLFGMPASVCSHGATSPAGDVAHIVTHYRYDDGKLVIAEGGWAMAPSCGFEMSFNIVLEKAVLSFDNRRSPTLKLFPAEGDPTTPETEPGDGYSRQIDHFVRRMRGERMAPVITPQEALDSLRIAEAERASARKGTPVDVPSGNS